MRPEKASRVGPSTRSRQAETLESDFVPDPDVDHRHRIVTLFKLGLDQRWWHTDKTQVLPSGLRLFASDIPRLEKSTESVRFRIASLFKGSQPRHMEAALVQVLGKEMPRHSACVPCQSPEHGTWIGCRRLLSHGKGACANCMYHGAGSRCDGLYKQQLGVIENSTEDSDRHEESSSSVVDVAQPDQTYQESSTLTGTSRSSLYVDTVGLPAERTVMEPEPDIVSETTGLVATRLRLRVNTDGRQHMQLLHLHAHNLESFFDSLANSVIFRKAVGDISRVEGVWISDNTAERWFSPSDRYAFGQWLQELRDHEACNTNKMFEFDVRVALLQSTRSEQAEGSGNFVTSWGWEALLVGVWYAHLACVCVLVAFVNFFLGVFITLLGRSLAMDSIWAYVDIHGHE